VRYCRGVSMGWVAAACGASMSRFAPLIRVG
jgi:hypothetical protein